METYKKSSFLKFADFINEIIANQDPDLDRFRLDSIEEIKRNSSSIKKTVETTLGFKPKHITIFGSVLDPKRFSDESDVDIAIYIDDKSLPKGSVEDLSYKVQSSFITGFSFGALNTVVINKESPKSTEIKL